MDRSRSSSTLRVALAVGFLAVQIMVPLVRMHPQRTVPLASRFSWTMFAAPLAAHCRHDLTWRDVLTHETAPLPLPPRDHPAREILEARTPAEFHYVAWILTRYPDSDAEVAHRLDDLLARYVRTIDPHGTHVLESTLTCDSDPAVPFTRTARFRAEPPR